MHNTLLHLEKRTEESKNTSLATSTHLNKELHSFNILPTAIVDVIDNVGNAHECTVLLDSGSQSNFLSTTLCKKLMLRTAKMNLNIVGISGHESIISQRAEALIKSKHSNFEASLQFLVTPQITSQLPSEFINIHKLKLPQGIKLADPTFHKPKEIDILIGVDLFWDILSYEPFNHPYLHKTKLGFVVSGSIPMQQQFQRTRCCNTSILSEQLRKFWEIEECPRQEHFSAEEKACEQNFITTTKRDEDGRFVVTIPFKASLDSLGDASEQAKRRFQTMERKLQRNKTLKEKYVKFMQEYQDLQHMSLVDENQYQQHVYYLPHHGVLKENSLTTKLRVVFDGSAATSSGMSLNDLQMVGPVMQQDLLSILLHFRQYPHAVGADITMMFRQIHINPEQRSLQRIFWRSDPSESMLTYELNTVTYGLASSSYLAIRCLFQLAEENEQKFPKIAKIIRNNMYVDDLLYGANTIEEAIDIQKQISSILTSAGFQLRKWISNEPTILNEVQDSEQNLECQSYRLGENDIAKTLGLSWSCATDELIYELKNEYNAKIHTKRTIASAIARIYDPLGVLGPFVLKAKIILQKLWLCKLSWDDPLPSEINTEWESFIASIASVERVRIPRQACCTSPITVEILAFSDASESAYGACVYVRSIDTSGRVFVNLLTAKSRVSPLKCLKKQKRTPKEPVTIPKLELCAALLCAKLVERVRSCWDINIDHLYYWCDSTIVLGWLKQEPYALKTFVSNRVYEIQSLTNVNQWFHVSSGENPADLLSRGALPQLLGDFWWKGPTWLSLPNYNLTPAKIEEDLPELKTLAKTAAISYPSTKLISFENYSNLDKLERIMAYCLRFINNTRRSKSERTKFQNITINEIRKSHSQLVKLSQYESFSEEIKCIIEEKKIKKGSKLSKLNPFIHSDGTLRVRGRLENSNYSFCKRHPIILNSKHHLTKLIFKREHQRLLHVGPQTLLSYIRDKYWPICGRELAKRTVSECITCFKICPKSLNPLMGNLPHDRVTPAPPFYVTGVDYAGPYIIKDRKGRGYKTSKCYIALFICFATRAIHLELVTDLTSDCFILSLRRFASRWGMPGTIYSDNGTTFVGARNELKELGKYWQMNESVLYDRFVGERFNWQFIPAYSPHFGGIWEAGVKSAKHHLRRVMKNMILTFEELYSLLSQISAILNSRPLTPLSTSPMDLNPLTPAHFLIGRSMTSVPDPDLCHIAPSHTSRYQLIQQLQQHFWTRWSKEFISELQTRSKWNESHASLKGGELVLIKDDNLPSMKWALGRVMELHPGVDSVVRVVTIRTSKGVTRRPVHKLCPLPIEYTIDENE